MMTFRLRIMLLSAVTIFILFAALIMRMYPSHSSVFASGTSIILSKTSGPPTSMVIITGSGYGPTEKVLLKVDTMVVGSVITDATGNFSTSITIPASATPGKHTIFAAGLTSHTSTHSSFLVRTDWPEQDFDSQHTAFNPYENVLSPSTASNLVLEWQHCLTNITCPPLSRSITALAEAEGFLYAVGNGIVNRVSQGRLWALRPSTGGRVWDAGPIHRSGFSAPAISNGVVYYSTGGGNSLQAINATTGQYLWGYNADESMSSIPAIGNGLVYVVGPGGPLLGPGGYLVALDAATGTLRWSHYVKQITAPLTVLNNAVFVCSTNTPSGNSMLVAFNALTGSVLWRFTRGCGSLRVANNVIYDSPGSVLYALDATTGSTLWSSPLGTAQAIANGVLYVVSSTQTLYALDAATGNTLWQFPLSCDISALANGVLYGTSANTLCAVNASTGSMLWSYAIANTTWITQPIVVNGKVYTSAGGYIYAFGLPGMDA
jgi:outer membrane protein assembly factor BamB